MTQFLVLCTFAFTRSLNSFEVLTFNHRNNIFKSQKDNGQRTPSHPQTLPLYYNYTQIYM